MSSVFVIILMFKVVQTWTVDNFNVWKIYVQK